MILTSSPCLVESFHSGTGIPACPVPGPKRSSNPKKTVFSLFPPPGYSIFLTALAFAFPLVPKAQLEISQSRSVWQWQNNPTVLKGRRRSKPVYHVTQACQPAGSGDFPVASSPCSGTAPVPGRRNLRQPASPQTQHFCRESGPILQPLKSKSTESGWSRPVATDCTCFWTLNRPKARASSPYCASLNRARNGLPGRVMGRKIMKTNHHDAFIS